MQIVPRLARPAAVASLAAAAALAIPVSQASAEKPDCLTGRMATAKRFLDSANELGASDPSQFWFYWKAAIDAIGNMTANSDTCGR